MFNWSVVRGPWSVVLGPWTPAPVHRYMVRGPWMLLRADVTLSLGKEASPRDSCAWRSCYPTRDIAAQAP
jgi:hypothetical protein